jgi:positive regulator of sigma E activity
LYFGWLVIPIILLAGFILGKEVHGTVGIVVSAVVGAPVYVFGLFILSGSAAVFTFDFSTKLLMVAFGVLTAIFGWFIGANYELLLRRKTKEKTT